MDPEEVVVCGVHRFNPLLVPAEQICENHGVGSTVDGSHGDNRRVVIGGQGETSADCGLWGA